MRVRKLLLPAFGLLVATAACSPATIAEAEAQNDVAWLERQRGRSSAEALGRLADHDARAARVLAERRGDGDVYHAAWLGHVRGAAWATDVVRAALVSEKEAPLVLGELPDSHPRLESFARELGQSAGLGAGGDKREENVRTTAAELLATVGPAGDAATLELLATPHARDTTCAGLAAPHATALARTALTRAAPEARTSTTCQLTLVGHAAIDPKVLDWVAREGEEPLVAVAAGRLDCPRVGALWERVLTSSRVSFGALEAPLATSMKRCAADIDPVTARLLPSTRPARSPILHALDTAEAQADQLHATCKQLPRLRHGRAVDEDVRVLAGTVLTECCRQVL